ncbi:hypothetical protein UlMin_015200 [Ulmus minor]
MPLSELYRMPKSKLDSNQDFEPGNDVFELVWENGQISTQGQSSRIRKDPICNNLVSQCLPSYTPRTRDKDVGNGSIVRTGILNEIPMSLPNDEVGFNHDDNMMSWLNYPVDGSLQHEYPDFLPELSGVTVHEISRSHNFASNNKSSSNQPFRYSNTNSVGYGASLEQKNTSRVTSVGGCDVTRPRTGTSHLYPSSSQQCQTSFPSFRSRVMDINGNNSSSAAHPSCDSPHHLPAGGSQDPIPPSNSSNVVNFSHFSRPAALMKANLQNIGGMTSSAVPTMERVPVKEKGPTANGNNPPKLSLIESSNGLRKETIPDCQIVTSGVELKPVEARPLEEPSVPKETEAVNQEDASKHDIDSNRNVCESATGGLQNGQRNMDPVVASSVCSGNSVERTSDDPSHVLKRKFHDNEESECHSDDVEEESVGAKRTAPSRPMGSKRSRAAEVHNLSERRRRDRINEKMRALQELIPNCNKVDKASMLDEAIEYLKTLQLQVQIMSMGTGLCMSPMMLPGMPHMHAPHMAHFSPMSAGMGMGLGMGMGMGFGMGMPDMNGASTGYPMMQVPPVQGAHFPGPHAAMHGMTGPNIHMFGIPGQGLPMPMQRPPLVPMVGGPFMKPAMGLNTSGSSGSLENIESSQPYAAKDPTKNMNSQVMQNTGAHSSMNQTSTQCQATNERFEQSAMVQNSVQPQSDINGSKASGCSTSANDLVPSTTASYD